MRVILPCDGAAWLSQAAWTDAPQMSEAEAQGAARTGTTESAVRAVWAGAGRSGYRESRRLLLERARAEIEAQEAVWSPLWDALAASAMVGSRDSSTPLTANGIMVHTDWLADMAGPQLRELGDYVATLPGPRAAEALLVFHTETARAMVARHCPGPDGPFVERCLSDPDTLVGLAGNAGLSPEHGALLAAWAMPLIRGVSVGEVIPTGRPRVRGVASESDAASVMAVLGARGHRLTRAQEDELRTRAETGPGAQAFCLAVLVRCTEMGDSPGGYDGWLAEFSGSPDALGRLIERPTAPEPLWRGVWERARQSPDDRGWSNCWAALARHPRAARDPEIRPWLLERPHAGLPELLLQTACASDMPTLWDPLVRGTWTIESFLTAIERAVDRDALILSQIDGTCILPYLESPASSVRLRAQMLLGSCRRATARDGAPTTIVGP